MVDLPPPETLRQPTNDVVHVNSTQTYNTISIGGKTYQILDVGYTCGSIAVTVMSEFTCLFGLAPYCNVCSTCWHVEGTVSVPDWESCGIPAGQYGILVKFKPPFICKCLKQLGYVSVDVNSLEPVGTSPYCGGPVIPPPLSGFNPFPLIVGGIAGAALLSATLPNGNRVSFESDGLGTPFRPGIDGDIDALPIHPSGTLQNFAGCPDTQPSDMPIESGQACRNVPNDPPNGTILTKLT